MFVGSVLAVTDVCEGIFFPKTQNHLIHLKRWCSLHFNFVHAPVKIARNYA